MRFSRHQPEVRVSPSLEEVQEEAAAFREESEQLRDALRELRGDIAETLDEIELFTEVRRDTEEKTRERPPDA